MKALLCLRGILRQVILKVVSINRWQLWLLHLNCFVDDNLEEALRNFQFIDTCYQVVLCV